MKKILIPFVAIALVLSACKPEQNTDKKDFVNNYAQVVYAGYNDCYTALQTFKTAAVDFIATPTAVKLDTLKSLYIAMRYPYEQTEAFRFYGGPIDNDTDGPEGLMNGWPMDESYVDYVVGNNNSGIINDTVTYPVIDGALLASLNQVGGESNISCGYHAIEFLLWGQDLSATGPGARPYTDYVTGAGGTATHQARRGQYLIAAVDLLLSHLLQVKNAWDPSIAGNYRESFINNYICTV